MNVTTRQVRLSNGLHVILRETHTAPVTTTWLWYRVGSRNEVEGHTGVSHWVEHMLFKGSTHFPKGSIMRAVDREGGYVNAITSNDFTTYYTTLPSARADLALHIEADRMRGATLDPAEAEAERTVILSEREGSENEPGYCLAEEMGAVAFYVHPYHHETIGWAEDLRHITYEQLRAHYDRYYVPNNAVLVMAGDFESDECLRQIEQHFGAIPPGEPPSQTVRAEPPQRGERRVVVRMPGSAPLVRISYHTPPVSHPDYIPLVVLDALLSGGKAMLAFGDSPTRSARLYRALVETQLATSAGSSYHPSLDPYLLGLGATVRDERTPVEVEQALLAEVDKLCQEPVQPHELAVAIRQTQAQFAYSSESVSNQALTLGFLEMVDHHERMDGLLGEVARITPEDVQRVARTYLHEDNRVTGVFLPTDDGGEEEEEVPSPPQLHCFSRREHFCAYTPGIGQSISPTTVARHTLENGIIVLIKENPACASVNLEGYVGAGSIHEAAREMGLANLTSSMLRRGTERRTFQEINVALDEVGASLSFSAGHDEVSFGGRALVENFDLLVELLTEILTKPTFPGVEMDKLRGQLLTQLGILDSDTGYRADCAFMEALYPPEHPYSRSTLGTRETLRALNETDLRRFHRAYYHPQTMILSVVGAVDPASVLDKLAATLGRWHVAAPADVASAPPATTPPTIATRRIELPGKAQADLIWGVVGLSRTSPDYYAGMMANLVLGRLGLMGRLGAAVRDDAGLAYYVASSLHAARGTHPWDIVAGVNPQNAERAVTAILREIERLREEPISAEELDDCRSFLSGSLPLRLETSEGIAELLLAIEEYGLGLDYLQRYSQIIDGVTREDVQRVVRQYLTLDRYVLTMAGTFS